MILDLPRPAKGYPFDLPKGEVAMSIKKERKSNDIGPPDKHEEANESEEIDLTGPYVPEENHWKSRKSGLPAPSHGLSSLLYGGA